MFKIFSRKKVDRVRQRQAKRILDLEAELEALRRVVTIKDAELESLAGVIARDRQRVLAETATLVRQRAECEGTHEQLTR